MDFGIKKVIGGFEVIKVKKGDFAFVKVSGLDGGWSVEWREDTIGFHMFDTVESDEDWDALHVIMCNSFIVSTVFDAALQHDIVMAAESFSKRLVEEAPKATEEEDAEALNELRVQHEMEEELKNGEEGKTEAEV